MTAVPPPDPIAQIRAADEQLVRESAQKALNEQARLVALLKQLQTAEARISELEEALNVARGQLLSGQDYD